jgi:hypothetical protein
MKFLVYFCNQMLLPAGFKYFSHPILTNLMCVAVYGTAGFMYRYAPPKGRSRRVRKVSPRDYLVQISPPVGFDSRTVQPVASHYTG